MSAIMSTVAVVLAAGALIASFAVPGPTGPQGAPGANGAAGSQGPPGPGTLQASNTTWDYTPIGATCTHYTNVTLVVPGPGTIVVTATAVVAVSHTAGQYASVLVMISSTVSTCPSSPWAGYMYVPTSASTGAYATTLPVMGSFQVLGAGTYTYNLNGRTSGADSPLWEGAALVAVFYPT